MSFLLFLKVIFHQANIKFDGASFFVQSKKFNLQFAAKINHMNKV